MWPWHFDSLQCTLKLDVLSRGNTACDTEVDFFQNSVFSQPFRASRILMGPIQSAFENPTHCEFQNTIVANV